MPDLDGYLNKITLRRQGNHAFGPFRRAHGARDDADRALEFALALRRISAETGRPLRTGVNRRGSSAVWWVRRAP